MTTFLTLAIAVILLTGYFAQIIKRVIVKPIAPDGRVGPELLAEKTRLDAWQEWLRPWVWGVAVGLAACPVLSWWVGWLE